MTTTHIHLNGTTGINIREVGLGSIHYIIEQSEHKIIIERQGIQKFIKGLEGALANHSE